MLPQGNTVHKTQATSLPANWIFGKAIWQIRKRLTLRSLYRPLWMVTRAPPTAAGNSGHFAQQLSPQNNLCVLRRQQQRQKCAGGFPALDFGCPCNYANRASARLLVALDDWQSQREKATGLHRMRGRVHRYGCLCRHQDHHGGTCSDRGAKHKDATTFRNTVRLLLVSNHLVRLDRVDAGFANRLVSLPFPVPSHQRSKTPTCWNIFAGKRPHFQHGYAGASQPDCPQFAYTEIDSSYLDQVGEQQLHMAANFESGVYDFIQMCCTIAPDAFVPSGELYRRYQSYTQANGRPAYTKTDIFSRVLCRLYPTLTPTKRYVEGKQCRCLEGIMLSAPSETNQHQKEESSHD